MGSLSPYPPADRARFGEDALRIRMSPTGAGQEPLSHRERECIGLMALGLTDVEIAARLGVQRSTVRFHFKNICTKLGAINRCSAVYRATRAGLI